MISKRIEQNKSMNGTKSLTISTNLQTNPQKVKRYTESIRKEQCSIAMVVQQLPLTPSLQLNNPISENRKA
jgi:hypothetical protein